VSWLSLSGIEGLEGCLGLTGLLEPEVVLGEGVHHVVLQVLYVFSQSTTVATASVQILIRLQL